MRPDNMPRPIEPEDDDIELLRPSNVELLRSLRDEDDILSDWEIDALTAAIAALEAVENADEAFVHDDNEIVHTGDAYYNPKHYGSVLIIPAPPAGGQDDN